MPEDHELMPGGQPAKVFIKRWGEPNEDWKELGVIKDDSVTLVLNEKDDPGFDFRYEVGGFEFTFKFSRKTSIRLQQALGLLKRPKFTYKTIKRDCAKRNR